MSQAEHLAEIFVASAVNEIYAMSLAVMLTSLAANLGPGRRVTAFVIEDGLSTETRRKIGQSLKDSPVALVWLTVDRTRLACFEHTIRSYHWFTIESYFRLLLPELLAPEVSKVIYLDSDLVINHDIGELWDLDPCDAYVLAVGSADPDGEYVSSKTGLYLYRELGLRPDQRMFNAGVLVINLLAWRERCLARRVFDYVRVARDDLLWVDQDGLNAMIEGAWQELDPRWNVTTHLHGRTSKLPANAALLRDPFIVHFTGAKKPWHADYGHGFQDLFFAHLDRTAWAGWRPTRPRFARLRNFASSSIRAVRKRHHALKRRVRPWRDQIHARRVLARSLRPWGDRPLPEPSPSEIRVFIVINRAGDLGPGLVDRHTSIGADRVILAVPQAGPEVASLLVRFPRLHVIETRHEHRSAAEILRYLLHRFGHGHWCLVLGPDDHFICPGAKDQSLRDLCARLDDAGFDALKCDLLNGRHADREQDDSITCADTDGNREPVRSIRTVALDELSGLVFVAQVDISEQAHAEDAGVQSRIALLRYRRGRGMAADLRAVDGYREADFSGTLLRSAASTVRPSPGQACSLAEPTP